MSSLNPSHHVVHNPESCKKEPGSNKEKNNDHNKEISLKYNTDYICASSNQDISVTKFYLAASASLYSQKPSEIGSPL